MIKVNETQLSSSSHGCIEYGNNNFWEVCLLGGEWVFVPHDSYAGPGLWEGYNFNEFFACVPEEHQAAIIQDFVLIKNHQQ